MNFTKSSPSRDPGDVVKQLLRNEVNFGCPVQGCGCPILTYHHFDPPWAGNFSHNPFGMIALCHNHHDQADGGLWTKNELREMKRNPYVDAPVRVQWPYSPEALLLKVGPCFVVGSGSALRLNGLPVLEFQPKAIERLGTKNIVFSSNIVDATGKPWLQIQENWLEFERQSTSDLYFTPQIKEFGVVHRDQTNLKLKLQNVPASKLEFWLKNIVRPNERAKQEGKFKPQLAKEFADAIIGRNTVNSDGFVPIMEVLGQFRTPEVHVMISAKKLRIDVSQHILGKPERVDFSSHLVEKKHGLSLHYDKGRFQGREFLGIG